MKKIALRRHSLPPGFADCADRLYLEPEELVYLLCQDLVARSPKALLWCRTSPAGELEFLQMPSCGRILAERAFHKAGWSIARFIRRRAGEPAVGFQTSAKQ
jgi:hypothetical protein